MRGAAAGILVMVTAAAQATGVVQVVHSPLNEAGVAAESLIREAREQALVRRALALRDTLTQTRTRYSALYLETARLRERADSARAGSTPDRFFAFHLSRVRRDAWLRRAETDAVLADARRLESDAMPSRKLADALKDAQEAASEALKEAVELDLESSALEASVSVTESDLLGRGAAHDAARVAIEARNLIAGMGLAQGALDDARKKALNGRTK